MKTATQKKIEAMPQVQSVDVEDGMWANLHRGWRVADLDCHFAHEWKWSDLARSLKSIEPCGCVECYGVDDMDQRDHNPYRIVKVSSAIDRWPFHLYDREEIASRHRTKKEAEAAMLKLHAKRLAHSRMSDLDPSVLAAL